MSINLTMLGQAISFLLFVLFCMKFVWPPLTEILRERRQAIADGLEKAAEAEKQLEQASSAADTQKEEAKQQAAELIAQAQDRASRIVADAKSQAEVEAERIRQGAQAEIDLEVSRATETLRGKVSDLALEGAEKVLESSVDRAQHEAMLSKLAERL
ncbi:MAG: F0F1 ATP synthase subunit B [Pseudomonadales bacterium]